MTNKEMREAWNKASRNLRRNGFSDKSRGVMFRAFRAVCLGTWRPEFSAYSNTLYGAGIDFQECFPPHMRRNWQEQPD